jgi:carbonic anhydrase
MEQSLLKLIEGYKKFRDKYVHHDNSVMRSLSYHGQKPETMIVACSDSRVDPALILQCEPGDLFVVRNVANIIPPYEKDDAHHGTSAALEFGVNFLKVKQLILLGHTQCGGIQALLEGNDADQNDFISSWVSVVKSDNHQGHNIDDYAKLALSKSYQNCLTFPWIKEKISQQKLMIHQWFFDISKGEIFTYSDKANTYQPLVLFTL